MSPSGNPQRVRRHIVYFGHVQGVFFRATCAQLSRGFDVTGYVRNLNDGSVELEAEGTAEQTGDFLAAIARHFQNNITRTHAQDGPPTGAESAFTVRY